MNLNISRIIVLTGLIFFTNISAKTDIEQFAKDAENILGEKANTLDTPDLDKLEERAGANDVNNKEEYGVLSSCFLLYTQIRNVVKTTFDEIQYWKGIKQSYHHIRKWFDDQKANAKRIRRISTELFSDEGNVFAKLKKAEELFDNIDHMAFHEPKRFSNLISNVESKLDKSILLPSTETVCFGIHMLGTKVTGGSVSNEEYNEFWQKSINEAEDKLKSAGITQKDKVKLDKKIENMNKYMENSVIMDEVDITQYSEYKVLEASRVMVSSSIAASDMYYNWASEALKNYQNIQDKTKDIKDLNDMGMLSSWLILEEINANNKLIRNQKEELKMYMHLLGLKTREKSIEKAAKYNREENYDLLVYDIKEQIKRVKSLKLRNNTDLIF